MTVPEDRLTANALPHRDRADAIGHPCATRSAPRRPAPSDFRQNLGVTSGGTSYQNRFVLCGPIRIKDPETCPEAAQLNVRYRPVTDEFLSIAQ